MKIFGRLGDCTLLKNLREGAWNIFGSVQPLSPPCYSVGHDSQVLT
jgi:hypothetical protein